MNEEQTKRSPWDVVISKADAPGRFRSMRSSESNFKALLKMQRFTRRAHRLLVLALASDLLRGMPVLAESAQPDSGIFGVVPYQAEDLSGLQGEINSLKEELLHPSEDDHNGILEAISYRQALRNRMKSECIQAFDPQSEMPALNRGRLILAWANRSLSTTARMPSDFREVS
jgi:hypothetical protein